MTIIVFGAGHVLGVKTYMGYTEDTAMLDLATRKAQYAASTYADIETHVMYVTELADYNKIQVFVSGVHANLCSLEHSNADDSINEEPNEPDRVVVYRTVINAGDGPCRVIGQACADLLQLPLAEIQHRYNKDGTGDHYGAIGRAMKAGCSDAWLIEHGFHTNDTTRLKLSDPVMRQQLAEKEVDAMALYYNWIKKAASSGGGEPDMIICRYGDTNSSLVTALQTGLLKLSYVFKGDSGTIYSQPTGGFFSATKSALAKFLLDNGLSGDGSEFTTDANAKLTLKLSALEVSTGITKAMLDAEIAKTATAEAETGRVNGLLKTANENLSKTSGELLIANNKLDGVRKARDFINAV